MPAGFNHEETEALAALLGHEGWTVLREHSERQIRSDTDKLLETDLDQQPCAAARLQGQIRRSKQILSVVEAAVKEIHAKE